ncbi:membrane protein [Candidatus Omnitrophus magneticus]|uniref:Membrane protein n=1 Tax=Candidatus Omnitrophus magneticus TaxID=1609969 RepID=A0A0F0CJF3_9BACT|nr:membrane protein [Candidatus Omnitrophus magneticus]
MIISSAHFTDSRQLESFSPIFFVRITIDNFLRFIFYTFLYHTYNFHGFPLSRLCHNYDFLFFKIFSLLFTRIDSCLRRNDGWLTLFLLISLHFLNAILVVTQPLSRE